MTLESELRRWIEVALQEGVDADTAAGYATGRVYDGASGQEAQARLAEDMNGSYALAIRIASEY